jgi:uncharacterized membrane protein
MTHSSIPPFVIWLCFVAGLFLIALAIPLWLRRVPPNALYGVRFRSTLTDPEVWYDLNARAGRDLVVIGIGYVLLLAIAMIFGRAWDPAIRVLVPTSLLVLALIVNTILLANADRQFRKGAMTNRHSG